MRISSISSAVNPVAGLLVQMSFTGNVVNKPFRFLPAYREKNLQPYLVLTKDTHGTPGIYSLQGTKVM